MEIDDTTIKSLATSLNFREMRQKIITSNIANAETPGYKAKRIDFEKALESAINLDRMQELKTKEGRHYNVGGGGFHNLQPVIYEDPDGIVKDDENTVDKEKEMARMAENEILYDASIQLLNKKLGLKNYAVSSER